MRNSCEEHNCEILSCGCHVDVLKGSDYFETLRAKDKWIKELLDEIDGLKQQDESDESLL